ncbi:unnamed protein product [Owenia fusiformis]|uniref:Uncharacterized protein n=1 Tax=Owenia fusiformis TaxID=6347 RepID=A0A8S4PTC5_OWEFU|nr:unnamed protein product [Owenia fusiformis]
MNSKTMFFMAMLFRHYHVVFTLLDNASLYKACKVDMATNAANHNVDTNCNLSLQPESGESDDPATLDVMATHDQIVQHVDGINHKRQSQDTKIGPRLRMLPTERLVKPNL